MAPHDFLSLPHEVRHEIYKAYFTLDGGYAFQPWSGQPGSGKLAAADGQPLDLALMYTCRLIASETKNLPLKHNVVSFATVYHPEWRQWAGRFDYLLRAQLFMQTRVLLELERSGHITPNIYTQIDSKFPRFVAALKYALGHHWELDTNRCLDKVLSCYEWCHYGTLWRRYEAFTGLRMSRHEISQAVTFALRLVAQELRTSPKPHAIQNLEGWRGDCDGLVDFLNQCYEPWEIPSESGLEAMGRRFGDDLPWSRIQRWERMHGKTWPSSVVYRSKYQFSAAALAIRFLDHLPTSKRLSIREIVLREDRIAVGYQECHATGLIPFCRENSRLRIDHRVSLLNNIFQAANIVSDTHGFLRNTKKYYGEWPPIPVGLIFRQLSCWSTESLAAVGAGMPADTYSLVFDGEPAIDLCSDIFQEIVLREAAFYLALDRVYPRQMDRHDCLFFSYICVGGAEAMRRLVDQTSVLRCNFHPGQMWSIDKFAKDIVKHPIDTIHGKMELRDILKTPDKCAFYPPTSLPSWIDLMMENYESRKILSKYDLQQACVYPKGWGRG
ncbi:hypothetical protein F53441_4005 [Fusarium austroafricanum]|uniref:Uncharacterized protein n=1 Tax=Fusarium austroafricanum TaxID=2364996 RepID=A0A8H4KNC1_9HYPO|nr:hypothetical protein F53441_4005 [Fusarium austroafricanum]